MPPDVVYEDNHILAVNKPAGIPTQPDNTGQPNLLDQCRQWLKEKYQKPGNVFLEAVHRLDKPASGIVLFAKTSKALSRLNASMRSKNTTKVYIAKLCGHPPTPTGTLTHYLTHGDHIALLSTPTDPNAKKATLHYKVLSSTPTHTTVEITLETGRYHQIRAQFAAINCPLYGDTKYNGSPSTPNTIALHHHSLTIPHPTTHLPLTLTSTPPF